MSGKARHGHSSPRTPTYSAWHGARKRCRSPTEPSYPDYGGRGISVCDRWQSFENFLADMGEAPEGMSLDRQRTDGDYEPGNCRWATDLEQQRNRRDNILTMIDGVTKTRSAWCEIYGIRQDTVSFRVRHGWTELAAITTPVRGYNLGKKD